ncbi:hypothetical protein KFE18_10825 [Clostridiaceae bacterium Marseille-Q4143]|nr:hypothetical protein KFE18_10825 [Clostridiaceae bacterium Marseille-Q4143]
MSQNLNIHPKGSCKIYIYKYYTEDDSRKKCSNCQNLNRVPSCPFFRQIAQKTYRLAIEFSTYKEQKTAPKKGLFQLVSDRICHINNVRKNKQTLQNLKKRKGFKVMKIIIERLQKVIKLHDEIEKKNWDYVKEVCDEDEEEKGYFVYKTQYVAPKGIRYDIIQVTDAKNYYKIFVYQDDKYKRKGIELVRKLLEAEKERQAKWEAEYDARIQEMKEETEEIEETEETELETKQVERVYVDVSGETLSKIISKVIDRTNGDYDYIFSVLKEGLSDLHFGRKIASLNFEKAGVKIYGNRLMISFLFRYVSIVKKDREGEI